MLKTPATTNTRTPAPDAETRTAMEFSIGTGKIPRRITKSWPDQFDYVSFRLMRALCGAAMTRSCVLFPCDLCNSIHQFMGNSKGQFPGGLVRPPLEGQAEF